MAMRKRDGVTGLFDALFFLAVASVVSVALLSAMSGGGEVDREDHDKVAAAHTVLLRSTLPGPNNNSYTVEELLGQWAQDTEDGEAITEIIDLLLPGREWSWTVAKGERTYHLGGTPDQRSSVYCSIVRIPSGGESCVFRLEAWSI